MGIFSFLKKAGKSLTSGSDAAPTSAVLKKEVEDLGLKTEGVEIDVEGDKVTVSGGDLTTEERDRGDGV